MDVDTTRLHLSVTNDQCHEYTARKKKNLYAAVGQLHTPALRFACQNCAAKSHLSDVEPVANDSVRGLGISLRPLQVVWVVVSLLDPDRVRRVEVELGVVGFCCGRKIGFKWGAIRVSSTHSAGKLDRVADRCTYWRHWTCMSTFLCCCWLGTRRSRCSWVPAWTSAPASPSGLARACGWTHHYGTSECQLGEVGSTAGLHTAGSPSGSSGSARPGILGPEWGNLQRQYFFQSMTELIFPWTHQYFQSSYCKSPFSQCRSNTQTHTHTISILIQWEKNEC